MESDRQDPNLHDFEEEGLERDESGKIRANRHPSRSRPLRLRSPRVRTITLSSEEMLEGIRSRMRRLSETGQIQVIGGREFFLPGAKEALDRLYEERYCIWKKIGPTRIPGMGEFQIQLNGVAYGFVPYMAWESDFVKAFNEVLPTRSGPHATRDRILWLLWHFRDRAIIQVGRTPNKVRGPLGECTSCGYRHRVVIRGERGCPRCHGMQYRDITGQTLLRPLGRITKAMLRRRFKVSRHDLDRILATVVA